MPRATDRGQKIGKAKPVRWLFFALFTLSASTAHGAGQERFALIIGANLGEPGDEPLRFAEEDARKMAHILTRFGSVPEENLLLLQGRNATRVEAAFKSLTNRIQAARQAQKETVLLVYYSGHADMAAMHLGRSRFEFDRLTDLLNLAGATFKILIMDACRSGELTRVKGAKPAQPFQIVSTQKLKSAGNAIITSSAAGEDAQESDRLGGGIFSHHFMSGLRGAADRSGDKRVSLSEAYRYAYDETLRTTSRARFIQHPTYAYKMKGREDLIITQLAQTSELGRVRLSGSGTWVLLNEANPAGGVMEVTTDKQSDVVVQPGRYVLRLRTARAVYEGAVHIRVGETQNIGVRQLKIIPYGRTIRKGYGRERRAALGLTMGSVLTGSLTSGVGPNTGATIGLRAHFRSLTLEFKARGTVAKANNLDVELSQRILGADLTVLKIYDPGYISVGFGLRMGGDWIQQVFETTGTSPDRNGASARAAPIIRLELPFMSRFSIIMSGFVDGVLLNGSSGRHLVAVPGIEVGMGVTF